MKVLQILVLMFGLSVLANAQKVVLSGKITDTNGGVIPQVKVVLIENKNSFSTITNDDGYYSLQIPAGIYLIEFYGVAGFLKTNVENYRVAPTKMNLDIVLEVDMESSTSVYSEFICKPNVNKEKESDCVYVSRKGDGTSKPTNIRFQTIKKN